MKAVFKNTIAISLPLQILAVHFISTQPEWIEKFYSNSVYIAFSTLTRKATAGFPFSVGDILYTAIGFYFIFWILKNRRTFLKKPLPLLRDVGSALAILYGSFYILWGLNYFRPKLENTLELTTTYTKEELISLTTDLITTANQLQLKLTNDSLAKVTVPYTAKEILQLSGKQFIELEKQFPLFKYNHSSIKLSSYSTALSYMGYAGYLNPFTNEAQVNRHLPLYRLPVVACHEIGHQLGYSAENDTNFIGYLAAHYSKNPFFNYSANTYALGYCLQELNRLEPKQAQLLAAKIHPGIKQNYQETNDFWSSYKNPLEPYFKKTFNTFLKANNQKEGIKSYRKIVGLLIAHHKKQPIDSKITLLKKTLK